MPSDSSLLTLWSDSAAASALVWIVVSIASLYLARTPAHELIGRLCQALSRILQLSSAVLLGRARRAAAYNREVLRAAAEEAHARRIERHFRRVSDRIERDLGGYPALHRALSEQVSRIDADYQQAADTPPAPPTWLAAIQAVVATGTRGDPAVAKILRDMHGTLEASCHHILLEYRAANRGRYRGLRRMQPYFRRVAATLEELQRRLDHVETHARAIDTLMAAYEALRARRRDSVRTVAFDTPLRFAAGLAMLAFAGLAAMLDYRLIAPPLNTLLGTSGAWTAAAALMFIELGLGMWIAEMLGATRLLGLHGYLDDRLRGRLIWAAGLLLGLLAVVQGALAWAGQSAVAVAIPGPAWLAPSIAALLGLILPFVLALAAVPLEAAIQAGRIVLGSLVAGALRLIASALAVAATIADSLAPSLKKLYDLWIFLPLWCEQALRASRARAAEAEASKER
jgi:hypothetical protein